jgi:hypothetical protein
MGSFFDTYFSKEQKKLELVNPKLDFKLNPSKFADWLVLAGECSSEERKESYSNIVQSMCEYSCLYIVSVLEKKKLKGKLKICYGEFGCYEHYWMSYKLEGVEYFIDLTLAQFSPKAKRLAITKASDAVHPTTYNEFEYISINDYMKYRRRDLEIIQSGKFKDFDMNKFLFGDKEINFDIDEFADKVTIE